MFVGCWLLVVGGWLLVVGWLLVCRRLVGGWFCVSGVVCLLLAVGGCLSVVGCVLFVVVGRCVFCELVGWSASWLATGVL